MCEFSIHLEMEIFGSVIQGERWLWLVLLGAKYLVIQHYVGESYFLHLICGGMLHHKQMRRYFDALPSSLIDSK
jgi:hypothetical protein